MEILMKRLSTVLAVCLFLAAGALAENKAPNFTLNRMNGGKFVLEEEIKKGPVLIDFWATWCKPCKKALPAIEHIHKTYTDSGLQVITISIDNPKSQAKIKPFIKGQKYSFDVLYDPNTEVRRLFGGKEIPLTVLINSRQEIVYKHLGYKPGDEEQLTQAITEMLTTSSDDEDADKQPETPGDTE